MGLRKPRRRKAKIWVCPECGKRAVGESWESKAEITISEGVAKIVKSHEYKATCQEGHVTVIDAGESEKEEQLAGEIERDHKAG